MKRKNKKITVEKILRLESDYFHYHKIGNNVISKDNHLLDTYDRLFMERFISTHNKDLTKELKLQLSKWKLTSFEMLMLLCYLGNLSVFFDRGNTKTSPYPINKMCNALDCVLTKAPACHEVQIVYRQCSWHDDVEGLTKGKIFTPKSYLTTSIDNWNRDNNQLVITLNPKITNAKSLYILRDKLGEKQVTFKKGSKFEVTDIKYFQTDDGEFKRFYMKELLI